MCDCEPKDVDPGPTYGRDATELCVAAGAVPGLFIPSPRVERGEGWRDLVPLGEAEGERERSDSTPVREVMLSEAGLDGEARMTAAGARA